DGSTLAPPVFVGARRSGSAAAVIHGALIDVAAPQGGVALIARSARAALIRAWRVRAVRQAVAGGARALVDVRASLLAVAGVAARARAARSSAVRVRARRARITAAVVRRALVDALALARLSHRVARQARGAGVAAV